MSRFTGVLGPVCVHRLPLPAGREIGARKSRGSDRHTVYTVLSTVPRHACNDDSIILPAFSEDGNPENIEAIQQAD